MAHIKEFNFCVDDCAEEINVFGPTGAITFFKRGTQLDQLLVDVGSFPSLTQARKNGFSGPIPDGWSEKPKGNLRWWIWNPTTTREEWDKLDALRCPEDTGQ